MEENVVLRSHLDPCKVVAWDGSAIICNAAFGLISAQLTARHDRRTEFWRFKN
jgi:hypothetical protein